MKATILIIDTNNKGDIQYQNVYTFDQEFLTAEALIKDRVCQEIEVYNQLKPSYFTGLVQPFIPKKNQTKKLPKRLEYERFYTVALTAFQNNTLSILVDDDPVTSLDMEIPLLQVREIAFWKYVPLVIGN